jgi:hypothetical protein
MRQFFAVAPASSSRAGEEIRRTQFSATVPMLNGPMASKRHLAPLIRVAVVMIAIQILPATALAHAGHTPHSISRTTHDHVTGAATHLNPAHENAEHTGAAAEIVAVELDANQVAAASGMCNDGCCASGFSCCVSAMLSETAADLSNGLSGSKVVRLRISIRPGIEPETLPKPPKSFT